MSTGSLPGDLGVPAWANEQTRPEDAAGTGGATANAGGSAGRLADRRQALLERIERAGGDPGRVRVVAVTKGFPPGAVAAALAAGFEDIGENYAQELVTKVSALDQPAVPGGTPGSSGTVPAPCGTDPEVMGAVGHGGAQWHFLGAIQRNKVRALAPLVACWQSVARAVEGEAIARHHPGASVLVEVDVTGAPSRNGCGPADVPALVAALRTNGLDVRGLMTVAPDGGGEHARQAFRTCRELADQLELPERSMGMSTDLELAVAEGTTMVRLGRALFGERPRRH